MFVKYVFPSNIPLAISNDSDVTKSQGTLVQNEKGVFQMIHCEGDDDSDYEPYWSLNPYTLSERDTYWVECVPDMSDLVVFTTSDVPDKYFTTCYYGNGQFCNDSSIKTLTYKSLQSMLNEKQLLSQKISEFNKLKAELVQLGVKI